MTHQQHLFEDTFDSFWVAANKTGNGGEVRDGVAGEGFENNIVLAAPFNLTAGGDALGIREENDF